MRLPFRNWAAMAVVLALVLGGTFASPARAQLFGRRVVVVPSSVYVVAPTQAIAAPVVVPSVVQTTYLSPASVVMPTQAVYMPTTSVVSPVVTTGYAVPAAPVLVQPRRLVVPRRAWYVLP